MPRQSLKVVEQLKTSRILNNRPDRNLRPYSSSRCKRKRQARNFSSLCYRLCHRSNPSRRNNNSRQLLSASRRRQLFHLRPEAILTKSQKLSRNRIALSSFLTRLAGTCSRSTRNRMAKICTTQQARTWPKTCSGISTQQRWEASRPASAS